MDGKNGKAHTTRKVRTREKKKSIDNILLLSRWKKLDRHQTLVAKGQEYIVISLFITYKLQYSSW